ncbi:alpha/beta-hydrolase [Daldinia caldariorum]|uniref:alpha/beta-hydrolase n=1 Tax=Daldinia caldariorum TaxID=326644 RepID=UPI002007E31C|nr:alpha/beta-hydrolase [Daldinia caldariorum]KAI1471038.1 alpha/beta-hydrolase [Daldinia caldariorum]
MANPGMLYVTMQPKPGLSIHQFHEWYNNEHGPTRLRLPQIFSNGLRYRAADGKEPEFLAVYDVVSMSQLETDTYTSLRANRSPREADTIGQVDVKRYFWDLVSVTQSPLFIPIEQLTDKEAEGILLLSLELELKDTADAEIQTKMWFKEHVSSVSKLTGWLRSRVLRTSSLESGSPVSFIALHEFSKAGRAAATPLLTSAPLVWSEIQENHATVNSQRLYELFYVFGPAPRDLFNLSRLEPSTPKFVSPDQRTVTSPATTTIFSYATAPDGLKIPYQLEGNPDPKAPVIAFCNSLLTSFHMWDPFINILKTQRPQYRILRYDFRGRHTIPSPPAPATLDTLADDLSSLLAALRIPKLDTLIGVSMGGATTLKFALKYPEKLVRFIACDFNAASSPANTDAWKQRIAIAETPLEDGAPGIQKLATQTVERWFHPATMEKQDTVRWMEDMVAGNDLQGFRYGCQALWDYDMKAQMKECQVPALLVVGEGDGKGALVKAMDSFKGLLGKDGAELAVVPEAGHLPMCENPGGFWKAVGVVL